MSKLKPVNFHHINTDEAQDNYCDGDKCEMPVRALPEQQEVPFDVETEETTLPDEEEVGVPVK